MVEKYKYFHSPSPQIDIFIPNINGNEYGVNGNGMVTKTNRRQQERVLPMLPFFLNNLKYINELEYKKVE